MTVPQSSLLSNGGLQLETVAHTAASSAPVVDLVDSDKLPIETLCLIAVWATYNVICTVQGRLINTDTGFTLRVFVS